MTNLIDSLDNRFVYHSVDDRQTAIMRSLRTQLLMVAKYMCANSPESRELGLAVTKLEEAMMWFNAGVARNK